MRIGNNPRIKVLLLHGGPGVTHECSDAFDSCLPAEVSRSATGLASSLQRGHINTCLLGRAVVKFPARHEVDDHAGVNRVPHHLAEALRREHKSTPRAQACFGDGR